MSELRHRYDRAAVSGRITQPPFAELAERGSRRAHRTRTARLAGVAVLAALVAAPLLSLPSENQPDPPAASSPPSWDSWEITWSFFDLQHGVATYAGDACGEGWLSVTRDGGRTWSELREHPGVAGRDSGGDTDPEPVCWAAVVPIAPDTLVIAGPLPPLPPERPSFISHDAGRTWREYEPQVRIADSVPDGLIPSWPCDDAACHEAGLGWYDPQTGDWMVLRDQPQGAAYDLLNVAFDGSIWVYDDDPGSGGDFHLAVSTDRGRSWQDRSVDGDLDWLIYALLTAYDGDTAYLYPALDSPEPDTFELYRTTDGGETWQPMPAAHQFEDVVDVWTNREGGLLVGELIRGQHVSTDQHLSTDGGETFARTELPVWLVGVMPGGGLEGAPLDRSAADPVDLYLSEDGLTWQPVQVPHYPGPADAPAPSQSPGR